MAAETNTGDAIGEISLHMDSEDSEKSFSRVLTIVVVAEVLIGVGAFLFVSPSAQRAVAGLQTFLAGNPMLLVLLSVMVLLSMVLLIVRLSSQTPSTLADLSRKMSIHFKGKRGNVGILTRPSLSSFGLYFEGLYHDVRVRYTEGKSRPGGCSLRKLSILHPRDLGLDLLCCHPSTLLHGLLSATEERELALRKVDMDGQGLELWSDDKEKALSLLRETDVSSTMRELSSLIDEMAATSAGSEMHCGFYMNDAGVTVVLGDRYQPEKALLDAMVRLSSAAATSPVVSAISPRKPDRSFEAAMARLLLFMVVIIVFLAWLSGAIIR